MSDIKKIMYNKDIGEDPCEKIVGLEEMYVLADFWERHGNLIELIATNDIIEYTSTEEFDSKEFVNFRKGVKSFGTFCMTCWNERRLIEEET